MQSLPCFPSQYSVTLALLRRVWKGCRSPLPWEKRALGQGAQEKKKKEALTYKFCRYGGALVSVLVAHCGLVVAERAAAGLIGNRKMR